MTRTKALLMGALMAGAISIPSTGSASAQVWYWGGCMYAPGIGGLEDGCTQVPALGPGNWARTVTVWPPGLTYACFYQGLRSGFFGDPGCFYSGGMGSYEVWGDPPGLTTKMEGSTFKLESKILTIKTVITCTKMEGKEPEIASGSKTTAGKTLESALVFTGCTVESASSLLKGCKLSEPFDTNPVESRLVENGSDTKVENLFRPQSGYTKFAEATFSGCASSTFNKTYAVEGTVLAEGGAEDEISKVKEDKAEEGIGTDDEGEAVEKPKLIFEPSSKEYVNDETDTKEEAGLTVAGSAAKLSGEATTTEKYAGGPFKDGAGEEVTIKEQVVDIGIDKE